jgi:hypothetical protein
VLIMRTPVTRGTVPEVTMVHGAERAIRSWRRDRAPGISTASSPYSLGRRPSMCWTSVCVVVSCLVARVEPSPRPEGSHFHPGNAREGYGVPGTLFPQQESGSGSGPLTFPSGLLRGKCLERVNGPPSMRGSAKQGQPSVRVKTSSRHRHTHSRMTSGATPISLPILLFEVS